MCFSGFRLAGLPRCSLGASTRSPWLPRTVRSTGSPAGHRRDTWQPIPPSRMTQPRSKRSAQPEPQARVSGPLHASREWVSGRFRVLRHKAQVLASRQFDYLSCISRRSSAPTRPLAAPDRTGASGRLTPHQNFRALNLPLVATAGWPVPRTVCADRREAPVR